MPSEKQIVEAFDKVAAETPGYIAASLVDLESGMTLGLKAARPDFDLAAASAYNSEMVKQKLKIMKALNLRTTLEDMLITLGKAYHLIRPLHSNDALFIYLVLDKSRANLAMARHQLRQVEKDLIIT